MITILRTNDIVLLSVIETMFAEEGVPLFIADAHVSAIEGSIGAFPRRVMVPEDWAPQARRLVKEAGLGAELLPEGRRG
jgi:hypothetical protein